MCKVPQEITWNSEVFSSKQDLKVPDDESAVFFFFCLARGTCSPGATGPRDKRGRQGGGVPRIVGICVALWDLFDDAGAIRSRENETRRSTIVLKFRAVRG